MRMQPVSSVLLLAGLTAVPALAQEAPFATQASLVGALDATRKATRGSTGLHLGLTYAPVAKEGLAYRLGLHAYAFPGREENRLKTSLSNVQVAGDVFVGQNLMWRPFFGISLNQWHASNSGTPVVDAKGVYQSYWAVDKTKGLKFGARFGVDVRINADLGAFALLQVSGLGNAPEATVANPVLAAGPVNPSWVQLGMQYRFGGVRR